MDLEFEPFVADDVGALASWLSSEPWPFHGLQQRWTEAEVVAAVATGEFTGVNRSAWARAGDTRVGLLRFRWLDEPSPDVDVRVLARYRGRGVGTAMLEWAAGYVFTETERHRLSGETRVDNLAMRRVFERCGWTQEAHYRASWPDGRGGWIDSVGYAILRDEWTAAFAERTSAWAGRVERYRETLELTGTDPVAGWERRLQVVVAPTGEAARFLAATEGEGSAWITRAEAEGLIAFLDDWLTQTRRDS